YHLLPSLFTTPNGVLQGISLLISLGNIYVAYYIYLYLSILALTLASFYLSLQILSKFVPSDKLVISSAIAASLSFIEPFVLTDYYSTLLGNGFVGFLLSTSFFILFLAFLFRSYSSGDNKSRFLNSFLLSGAFLGLSLTPFPNDMRLIIIGYIFFAATIVFFLISDLFDKAKKISKKIPSALIVFVLSSLIFSLWLTYPMLSISGFKHYIDAASIGGGGVKNLGFYTGGFNTIPQVIRLLGAWTFPTGVVIYHNVYYEMNFVNVASYFWPLLALFFPLVIAFGVRRNRGFLMLIMVLVLLSIFWEKGANPPFGSIWYFVNSKIPFGYEFMQTGSVQYYVLGTLYPVLATLSIIKIYSFLKARRTFSLRKRLRKLVVLVPIALVIILVVAEMPVFDGQLEKNFFNVESSGFFIPSEYDYARDYLLHYSKDVLLFPGVGPWITTTWNYSGSSEFFYSFFQPVNVTDTYLFKDTSTISSGSINTYNELVSPFPSDSNSSSLSIRWLQIIADLNISYIIFDYTLLPNQILHNYTYYMNAIHLLILEHIASLTLSFKNLQIYKLNESQIMNIVRG
ncbi:MAG: hypothetical protein QXU18_15915, partial [Thermoplasmatales archaeon]